ncbi:MAG: DUF6115 domain-containing protein [Lachnospiraceae bacterium]|nr:DUF6115 domain-containing protein [Lachnospiraceae bacterium]
MGGPEIALLIVGVLLVLASIFLVKKKDNEGTVDVDIDKIVDASEKKIDKLIKERLSEVTDEKVVEADDSLSKLSNEKLMSMNEFSEQVLQKIETNNREVVFMYDLLNKKEEELKKEISRLETLEKNIEALIEKEKSLNQELKERQAEISSTRVERVIVQSSPVEKKVEKKTEKKETTTVSKSNHQKDSDAIRQKASLLNDEIELEALLNGAVSPMNINNNKNEMVISLYKEGKSIKDIAKLLGMGQGEVKLMINLQERV